MPPPKRGQASFAKKKVEVDPEEERRKKAEYDAAQKKKRLEAAKRFSVGGTVPLSTQSAAKYNSKTRPAKDGGGANAAAQGGASGGGAVVVVSEDLESRLRKLEEPNKPTFGQRGEYAMRYRRKMLRTRRSCTDIDTPGGMRPGWDCPPTHVPWTSGSIGGKTDLATKWQTGGGLS